MCGFGPDKPYLTSYVNSPQHMAGEVGYPKDWLEQVAYADGPITYRRSTAPGATKDAGKAAD